VRAPPPVCGAISTLPSADQASSSPPPPEPGCPCQKNSNTEENLSRHRVSPRVRRWSKIFYSSTAPTVGSYFRRKCTGDRGARNSQRSGRFIEMYLFVEENERADAIEWQTCRKINKSIRLKIGLQYIIVSSTREQRLLFHDECPSWVMAFIFTSMNWMGLNLKFDFRSWKFFSVQRFRVYLFNNCHRYIIDIFYNCVFKYCSLLHITYSDKNSLTRAYSNIIIIDIVNTK